MSAMRWLAIALICAVGVIGVETYLLLKPVPPLPPAPPVLRVIAIPPPPAPRPVVKRKGVRATTRRSVKPLPEQHPFVTPTGGIFSGADPQDARIYHLADIRQ